MNNRARLFASLGIAPLIARRRQKERLAYPYASFAGAPTYLSEFQDNFRDNGGPLSPFGSHVGIKLCQENVGCAAAHHYACGTGQHVFDYSMTGLFGTSWLTFKRDAQEQPLQARHVQFDYFGWLELATYPGFRVAVCTHFVRLNEYQLVVEIENQLAETQQLAPSFHFQGQARKIAFQDGPPNTFDIRFRVMPTILGGGCALRFGCSQGGVFQAGGRQGQFTMSSLTIPACASRVFTIQFKFAFDEPPAPDLDMALSPDLMGVQTAWQQVQVQRRGWISLLPAPHISLADEPARDLYACAALAVEQALYARRGKMQYWGCVPNKVHYNWFWLWDTGFNSIGYSEYRPDLAMETVLNMFSIQAQDGFIAHMSNDRLAALTRHSMAPVFGFTTPFILQRCPPGQERRQFLEIFYRQSVKFLAWWEKRRDNNHNGLLEYLSVDESGGDNSPRAGYVPKIIFINYFGYLGELIASKTRPLDSADLNAWMYQYETAMAGWAAELGYSSEVSAWQQKAHALAEKIDQVLWDEPAGCWLDAYMVRGGKERRHFRTLTPWIWFPAFLGATRSETKARRVIEQHLLNPNEFFGPYPIPSVAYNDPDFDPTVPGWTSSIWMPLAYSALVTLFQFGYTDEARELKNRLVTMLLNQGDRKGVFETYDPLTGKYKNQYSNGYYCTFQYSWSGAFIMEMLLDRHEERRFLFPATHSIQGFIRQAVDFASRQDFYRVECGRDAPWMSLESLDGQPLLQTAKIRLQVEDPYHAFSQESFVIWIKGRSFTVPLAQPQELSLA